MISKRISLETLRIGGHVASAALLFRWERRSLKGNSHRTQSIMGRLVFVDIRG